MTGSAAIGAVELDRGETRIAPELLGGDLVGGDAVGHVLPGDGVAIGASQPVGAAPVGLVAELVRAALHYSKVVLVPSQWGEALRQGVIGSLLNDIGEPRFLGHAKPNSHEGHPFGGSDWHACGGRGKSTEADGLQSRQRDQRSRAAKKVTTIDF